MTFFNIISFYVCVPFSFVLWRRWQFPGYALIWLLYCTNMSPKIWGVGDTILTATAEGSKKTSHPWKLKISGCKIDSWSILFRISSHKLIELSWCPPPRKMGEGKFLGWWGELLNWVLNLTLVHRDAYRKASKLMDSIFTAHLDLCFI